MEVLNGKCSDANNSCPAEIYGELFEDGKKFWSKELSSKKWNCETCIKNFINLDTAAVAAIKKSIHNSCPCEYLTYSVCEARIKEMIEECS